jgi:hypothetical protein
MSNAAAPAQHQQGDRLARTDVSDGSEADMAARRHRRSPLPSEANLGAADRHVRHGSFSDLARSRPRSASAATADVSGWDRHSMAVPPQSVVRVRWRGLPGVSESFASAGRCAAFCGGSRHAGHDARALCRSLSRQLALVGYPEGLVVGLLVGFFCRGRR